MLDDKKFPSKFELSHAWTDLNEKSENYSRFRNYGDGFNILEKSNFTFLNKYWGFMAQTLYFNL